MQIWKDDFYIVSELQLNHTYPCSCMRGTKVLLQLHKIAGSSSRRYWAKGCNKENTNTRQEVATATPGKKEPPQRCELVKLQLAGV